MMAEMARVMKPGGVMIHVVPSVMSALHTLVQANVAAAVAPHTAHRWSLREWLRPKSSPRWVIPELHSEFLRGNANYNDQLNLYLTDGYVPPMMEAGFGIERLVRLRDYNVAIVARRF